MKKVLLPINEKDYGASSGRIVHIMQSLSNEFMVEILTNSKSVYDEVSVKITDNANIHLKMIEIKFLPFPFKYRDDLAKIFIQYTKDIVIPGTDLKIWEIAAFDDFWGHISNCAFSETVEISADVVILPLMGFEDHPWDEADVFYTTIAFTAKEKGIKLAGYQVYPVFSGLKLMPRLMDALIVREQYEREFYLSMGIDGNKIHMLTDPRDNYSLCNIEDVYREHLYFAEIEVRRDELGVVVCNHSKFRPVIKEIFNLLSSLNIPVVLFLLKRQYTVRELSEEQIMEGMYYEDIRKITKKFYLVEMKSVVPIIMISDVVVSPSLITPLEFAVWQGKKTVVYNPFYGDRMLLKEGIEFADKQSDLDLLLKKAYAEKQERVSFNDIVRTLC